MCHLIGKQFLFIKQLSSTDPGREFFQKGKEWTQKWVLGHTPLSGAGSCFRMDRGERIGGLLRGWRRLFFTSVGIFILEKHVWPKKNNDSMKNLLPTHSGVFSRLLDGMFSKHTWVGLTSSWFSCGSSVCFGVGGPPTSESMSTSSWGSWTRAVANCSKAFSKPVIDVWVFSIFFGFFCFLLSMLSVMFWGFPSSSGLGSGSNK